MVLLVSSVGRVLVCTLHRFVVIFTEADTFATLLIAR